jgi:probable blue pigment (indigoidine) exporter
LPTAAPPLLGLAAPVTGVALGWLVLDQSLSLVQLLGFAITIGAMFRGATLRPTTKPVASIPTLAPTAHEPDACLVAS